VALPIPPQPPPGFREKYEQKMDDLMDCLVRAADELWEFLPPEYQHEETKEDAIDAFMLSLTKRVRTRIYKRNGHINAN